MNCNKLVLFSIFAVFCNLTLSAGKEEMHEKIKFLNLKQCYKKCLVNYSLYQKKALENTADKVYDNLEDGIINKIKKQVYGEVDFRTEGAMMESNTQIYEMCTADCLRKFYQDK